MTDASDSVYTGIDTASRGGADDTQEWPTFPSRPPNVPSRSARATPTRPTRLYLEPRDRNLVPGNTPPNPRISTRTSATCGAINSRGCAVLVHCCVGTDVAWPIACVAAEPYPMHQATPTKAPAAHSPVTTSLRSHMLITGQDSSLWPFEPVVPGRRVPGSRPSRPRTRSTGTAATATHDEYTHRAPSTRPVLSASDPRWAANTLPAALSRTTVNQPHTGAPSAQSKLTARRRNHHDDIPWYADMAPLQILWTVQRANRVQWMPIALDVLEVIAEIHAGPPAHLTSQQANQVVAVACPLGGPRSGVTRRRAERVPPSCGRRTRSENGL